MHEEVELGQSLLSPLRDPRDPFIETCPIGLGVICADPSNERLRRRQTHVHQIASTGGVDQHVRDVVLLHQPVQLACDLRVVVPIRLAKLHRDRTLVLLPALDKRFDALEILRVEVVVHLHERHAKFLLEKRRVLGKLFDLFVAVLQSRKVRNALRKFRKEKKAVRHAVTPRSVLLFPIPFVEGRVEFEAIELRRVVRKFVLGFNGLRIKTLQVFPVPLRASDIDFEVFALRFRENTFRIRMIRRDREIDLFGVIDLSEFHRRRFYIR